PADRWLSAFKSSAALGEQLVPLAFHVDYWDYIGWKDRFADPRFGERQRAQVMRAGSRLIVTPQIFLNGRPLSGGNWDEELQRVLDGQRRQQADANLDLAAQTTKEGWLVTLNGSTSKARKLNVFLARYEQGLFSNVTAGENKGVRLNHDFVVREWEGPLAAQSAGTFIVSHDFRHDAKIDAHAAMQTGFAAVVEDARNGALIQVVATGICPS
ncbi:MAG TPA: DUF1223 domain-containing protein, partial [Rhodocyclaceae bacterium]|nr:DUF1223 domain-containing protein [Rhodocyclaceae bacterium]